jgi:hypothetical protein
MRLYEINEGLEACIDTETGELLDEEKYRALLLAKDEKLENIACWIKNLRAESEAIRSEEIILAGRRKRNEKLIARLELLLENELQGQKFSTARVAVSFRRSEVVDIAENAIATLPPEFLTYAEPKPNKTEIKKHLKGGGEIAGCTLTEHMNIQIK